MSDMIDQLTAFATAPIGADAPRDMMALSLLDWAAVAMAGQGEPVSDITRAMALEDGGAAQASVIGTAQKLPARAAAMVNGAVSHALDYDDTHFAHIGHPSVAVLPAALAMAEMLGAGGEDMLDAALVGVEGSIRVGRWLGRDHYQIGFHQTATAGAFGATLAAGRLIGLSAHQMAHALGLCATRAAGLKSQFGTMGKPYHAGLAAQTGVEVARAAKAGFISNPDAMDSAQGFGPTHAGQGDLSAFDGLGQQWDILTISHKFHACCHGTHAMLEALRDLTPSPDDIRDIQLWTHPRWLPVCNIAAPQTGLEAKFSYAHTAAMALSGHDTAALDSFTDALAQDPALRALAARMHVMADDNLAETAARVEVTLGSGAVLARAYDLNQPMPFDTRRAKIIAKTRALLGERAGALTASVEARDLPSLGALLRG